MANKFDDLVKKAELFERLALYGNRKSFLSSLAQGFTQEQVEQWDPSQKKDLLGRPLHSGIPPVPPEQSAGANANVMQMPADHITAYPPVDKNDQKLLSEFMVQHGAGIPLSRLDGKMGPETRQALNNFKKYLRQPNMSDQEVFSLLKLPAKVNQMVASIKATPQIVNPKT